MKMKSVVLWIQCLGAVLSIVCGVLLFIGCEAYQEWRNNPPEINTFTVPKEVRYGETVELRVGVLDPENEPLTFTWVVSDGELSGEGSPEVEWTAPALPNTEIAPDQVVRVHVTVRDDGEESAVKSETITVYSKAYRVAKALSGSYELIRTEIAGTSVEEFGSMRLTTTTFTREFQSNNAFEFGTYQLIEPFDAARGTIYWYTDDNPEPLVSTYTWDGELFVVFHAATATGYIYQKQQ